jgi:RNA polymerase sigma factor (sigma-70 family)
MDMTSVVALRFTGPAPVMTQTFEEIYAEQLDYVWHSLRRLGVDDRDREDLAHDVFLVVYRRLASYDPACSLRAWLFGIAYRVVADHRRRARVKREVLDDTVEAVAPPPAHADKLDIAKLPVVCTEITVAADPDRQRFTVPGP